MEITRNQYFGFGVVLFLLGMQFLQIESVELKECVAKFIAERTDHPLINVSAQNPATAPIAAAAVNFNRTIHPPEWMGWPFLSFGVVGILHALAMPKKTG